MKLFYIENDSKDAAFHFAAEEYILRTLSDWAVLVWQTDRCVMLGKNQLCGAEIDLGFAAKNNIQITRRSSGGGAIFTDAGTFLFTLIMPAPSGENPLLQAKRLAAQPVVNVLQGLGVDARLLGRNDILIGDKKVSGIAQYAGDGRICTHGSLLFDADLDILEQVLTPDAEKLSQKAVRSVKSRVTNIKNHLKCDIAEFARALRKGFIDYYSSKEGREESGFCGDVTEHRLTPAELAKVEKIMRQKYANKPWVFGESIPSHMPVVRLESVQSHAQAAAQNCTETNVPTRDSAAQNCTDTNESQDSPTQNYVLPKNCEYMFCEGVITSDKASESPKQGLQNASAAELAGKPTDSAQSQNLTAETESFHTKARFVAGGIDLFMEIERGTIKRVFIRGDFLATEDIEPLEKLLTNTPFEKTAMDNVLGSLDLSPYLGGITKDDFLSLIF